MRHYKVTLTFTLTHIYSIEAKDAAAAKNIALLEAHTCPELIQEHVHTSDVDIDVAATEQPATVIPFPRSRGL